MVIKWAGIGLVLFPVLAGECGWPGDGGPDWRLWKRLDR